mgnify:CR=1 FL=1
MATALISSNNCLTEKILLNPLRHSSKVLRQRAKRFVWAPAKDVLKNTIIVLVVVIIAGLAIYGVDSLLSLGMKGIKNLAETTTTTSASQQGKSTTAAALDKATTAETTKAAE